MASPIADLTYRNYDGELSDTRFRWWVIARAQILTALKKKSIWFYAALSGSYYLVMIIILFFLDQASLNAPPGQPNPMEAFLRRIVWKDQFVHGFSVGQMWFLAIALVIGAGAIANDNRANALLVYLSKPCDKRDYLFGKWFGVFLPLVVVMAVPSLMFFLYGAMSYKDWGFLSEDPWMLPKLIVILAVGAAFHASLVIGFSAMFNRGTMAGAVYAGFYFIGLFFTKLMLLPFLRMTRGGRDLDGGADLSIVSNLFYGSVDGLNIGLAKGIFGTNGTPYFGISSPVQSVPSPPLWLPLFFITALSALLMYIAWCRIKPVEIVG